MLFFDLYKVLERLINKNKQVFNENYIKVYELMMQEKNRILESIKNKVYYEGTIENILGLTKHIDFSSNDEEKRIKEKFEECIKNIKNHVLVSCFSERNDSILMWSHYADSHRGVCIEFETPVDECFKKVKYQEERPVLKIYNILLDIILNDLENKNDDCFQYKNYFSNFLVSFYTKSIDWSYEKEIRYVNYIDGKYNNIYLDSQSGKYVIDLKPIKIYIGSKADPNGDELNRLIKIAKKKGIRVSLMKEDSESFSIIETSKEVYFARKVDIKKETILSKAIEDLKKCLNSSSYLSAFITALFIPSICSKFEFFEERNDKLRYIKWYNKYFNFNKPLNEDTAYLSGEVCWDICKQLLLKGNLNIVGKYNSFSVEVIKFKIESKNYFGVYGTTFYENEIMISIRDFCENMIRSAKECYENHKEDIEKMIGIEFIDVERVLE